jgi:hypothetical protein
LRRGLLPFRTYILILVSLHQAYGIIRRQTYRPAKALALTAR